MTSRRVDESDPETFHAEVLRNHPALVRFADHHVRADPAGCANTALTPTYDPTGHQLARYIDTVAGAIAGA